MQGLMDSGKIADIIAIQEPYIGNARGRKKMRGAVELGGGEITVGNGAFDIIYRPGRKEGEKSRVMWMVRKRKELKYTIRDDIWADWDASIMDIRRSDGETVRIINVYNQMHKEREGWCMTRFPREAFHKNTILVGDFNAKATLWDSISEPIREEEILGVVEQGNFTLANEPDRITWQRGRQSSVLDLSFATQSLISKIRWKLRTDFDTGSDHAVCETTLLDARVDTYEATSCRWDYRNADWGKVKQVVEEEKRRTEEEWKYGKENEDCELLAELLEKTIMEGVKQGVKEARRCPQSKKWFDEEVKEKRKEMAKKRRWGRKGAEGTEIKMHRVEEWKRKRTEYFQLIRRKKKECWDKFVKESEDGNLWNVWRVTMQKRYAKTPALITEEGEAKVTFEEKELLFLRELFPPSPPDPQINEARNPNISRIDISNERAREAIFRQGSYKAPGPDEIAFIAIKELWEVMGERITEVYQLCLDLGFHPRRWRKAVGAIIPKANKPDYTKPKAYRPISLLNTLGKGLERIVADYLADFGEKGGLVPNQWGGRKYRSAEDCVSHTLDWTEKRRSKGEKVMLVAMDVSQAFPNTSKVRLANTLREGDANTRIVDWVMSFLSERKVTLRFDNEVGAEREVETGIPQGSPASPILFNLFIALLLKEINRYIEEEFEGKAIVPTYIDDLTIAVAGKDWEQARARAEGIIEKAYEWAALNCVQFDEKKMEWIRLFREDEEEVWSLELPNGAVRQELEVLKWLGVWIDRKCTFKRHVKEKTARATRAVQSVIRLARGSQGIEVGNGRKMYIACSRQIAEYGGKVWWKGQKGLAAEIDKVNINAMRKIGGHFRTAPIAAIEVENDMIPTAHRFDHKQRMQALKALQRHPKHPMHILAKGERDELVQGGDDWLGGRTEIRKRNKKRGIAGAMEGVEKLLGEKGRWEKMENWKKLYKKEEKWEKRIREEIQIEIRAADEGELRRQIARQEEANEIVMYSDGSKNQEGETAAGICRMGKSGEVLKKTGYRLGKRLEIMDAEMVAIKKAIEIGMKEAQRERKQIITIRADSQEALKRIGQRRARNGEEIAHKIRWLCDAARTQKMRVRFEWVKAHEGVRGNEEADKVAKGAAGRGTMDKDAFVSFAYLQRESGEVVIREWERGWMQRRNERRQLVGPQERYKVRFDDADRSGRVLISRLRTGHIVCNEYLNRIGKRPSAECECGAEKQDVEHILTTCPQIVRNGHQKGNSKEILSALLWTKEGVEKTKEIWRQWREARAGKEERSEVDKAEEREMRRGWGDLELN